MITGMLPLGVSAITTDQVTSAMTNLKNTAYPDDWYWCGGDINKSLPSSGCGSRYNCLCNSFNYSYQCHGFALYMAQRVIGSCPGVRLADYRHGKRSNGWSCYTVSGIGKTALCAMGLRPGDIIRASNRSDYSDGHTVIVWKVEGNTVYFAEAWGSVYCKINWGGFNAAYTSMSSICSAYAYVALWRSDAVVAGNGVCPHSYREGYEGTHPHRKYTTCIYCQETKYTGEYATHPSCVCCNNVHSYVLSNEAVHPHKEIKTCSLCGYYTYSGKTAVRPDCTVCQGVPYDLKVKFDKAIYNIGESVKLEFSASNAIKYKAVIRKDGVKHSEHADLTATSLLLGFSEVGSYTATVTAYSKEGKSLGATTSVISVRAPITAVSSDAGRYYITYGFPLSYNDALDFCEARDLILTETNDSSFTAFFATDERLESEFLAEELYTYFPLPLSYYEAVDFSKCLNGVLASSVDAETEKILVKLCVDAGSDGILLGSNDTADEGTWVTEEGNKLSYLNWNISYSGEENFYKSCLFMFPGGTVTDSYVRPYDTHGFVLKSYDPFEYTDNGDGTLTLYRVAAIESSSLNIPSQHNGMPVTAIHPQAFANGVYGVLYIPSSVKQFSAELFDYADIKEICADRDSEAHRLIIEYGIHEQIPFSFRLPFTDVGEKTWYYEGVNYCYQSYYISGTSPDRFSPHSNITREQFVMMLANIAGVDLSAYAEADTGMGDVPSGKWYSAAVAWAVAEGYVSGVSEGVFGLGQNITREQLARLLYLYSEKQGADVEARADLSIFTDEASISEWAYDNVSWAVAKGLISGMKPTELGARGTATRAQAARIFMMYDIVMTETAV